MQHVFWFLLLTVPHLTVNKCSLGVNEWPLWRWSIMLMALKWLWKLTLLGHRVIKCIINAVPNMTSWGLLCFGTTTATFVWVSGDFQCMTDTDSPAAALCCTWICDILTGQMARTAASLTLYKSANMVVMVVLSSPFYSAGHQSIGIVFEDHT